MTARGELTARGTIRGECGISRAHVSRLARMPVGAVERWELTGEGSPRLEALYGAMAGR